MDLQRKERYDLNYQKSEQLGRRPTKTVRTYGITDSQGNIVTDHRLRIWEKYIQNLYDSENRPKDIITEADEELNEGDIAPIMLKCKVVKSH